MPPPTAGAFFMSKWPLFIRGGLTVGVAVAAVPISVGALGWQHGQHHAGQWRIDIFKRIHRSGYLGLARVPGRHDEYGATNEARKSGSVGHRQEWWCVVEHDVVLG